MKISKIRASYLAALILAGSLSVVSCERTTSAVSSSDKASDFTLKAADGSDYSFQDNTKGKVVILNFWAQRCPACKVEIPNLVDMYDKYGKEGLEVIGIEVDGSSLSGLQDAISRYRINYPLLTGKASEINRIISSYGGFRYIPTTYIIDREGGIVDKVSGVQGKAYYEENIKELL